MRSNQALLALLAGRRAAATPPVAAGSLLLSAASFAEVYHGALQAAQRGGTGAWLARLRQLAAQPENAPYYEQLLFLQALLLHTAGQEVAARQALAPLAAGTSATAGYYQYLLGLWQLQQQQYATAAAQLELAGQHGATLARPARAWALALAGQPDSAAAIGKRLAASPEKPEQLAGRQLLASLAAPPAVAAAPSSQAIGHKLRVQAQQAEQNPQQAAALYQQLLKTAPFNEAAVLAAARFYTTHRQPSDAYEALRLGLVENPASEPLQRAFVLAAADAGLAELAQPALDQLRPRLDAAAYTNLLAQFAARRAAYAASVASFSAEAGPVPAPRR